MKRVWAYLGFLLAAGSVHAAGAIGGDQLVSAIASPIQETQKLARRSALQVRATEPIPPTKSHREEAATLLGVATAIKDMGDRCEIAMRVRYAVSEKCGLFWYQFLKPDGRALQLVDRLIPAMEKIQVEVTDREVIEMLFEASDLLKKSRDMQIKTSSMAKSM